MLSQEILAMDAPALEDLLLFRGSLFEEWVTLWDALAPSEKDPFTRPIWVVAWLRGMPAPERRKCHVHVLRNGKRLVGLLPLSLRARRLPGIGAYHLVHELVLISSAPALAADVREEALALLVSSRAHFNRRPLMLTFLRVDETNGILARDGRILKTPAWPRRILALEDGYEVLHQRLGKNMRQGLRKKTRQLERQFGRLQFETLRQPVELSRAFEVLVDMEVSGWKRDSRYALRRDDHVREFLLSLMEGYRLNGAGSVLLHRLLVGDVTLAILLSVQTGGALYGLKTVFNERFSKYSPGHLLFDFIFREHCPAHGVRHYNSIDISNWFSVWNPKELRTFEVRLFPPGVPAWCAMTAVRVHRRLRSVRARLVRLRTAIRREFARRDPADAGGTWPSSQG